MLVWLASVECFADSLDAPKLRPKLLLSAAVGVCMPGSLSDMSSAERNLGQQYLAEDYTGLYLSGRFRIEHSASFRFGGAVEYMRYMTRTGVSAPLAPASGGETVNTEHRLSFRQIPVSAQVELTPFPKRFSSWLSAGAGLVFSTAQLSEDFSSQSGYSRTQPRNKTFSAVSPMISLGAGFDMRFDESYTPGAAVHSLFFEVRWTWARASYDLFASTSDAPAPPYLRATGAPVDLNLGGLTFSVGLTFGLTPQPQARKSTPPARRQPG